MWASIARLGCFTSDPAYVLGKQHKMARVNGTLNHVGDPKETPGSRLQINSALAIVVIWEVKQWMVHLLSLLSASSAFQIKVNKYLINYFDSDLYQKISPIYFYAYLHIHKITCTQMYIAQLGLE